MAGTPLATAFVSVRADTKQVPADIKDGFNKADTDKIGRDHGDRFSKGMSAGILGGAKGIAGGMAAVFAAAGVSNIVSDIFGEAREAQRVGNITANAIKVTGGVAKVSQKQVEDLSQAISNKTGIDDEAVQSGANLLLTFKNVRNELGKGNDVFSQATGLAQDLAAAGFGDADGAAKMLGKALNDPVKGMTALGKAGVTFTADQKKQIATLTKTGDLLGAQKVILGEVQAQVGGAAAAAADPMQKLGVIVGNLEENLGTALLPVIENVATWLGDNLPNAVETLMGWLDTGKIGVEALVSAFNGEGVTSDGFVGFMERVGVVARTVFDYFQSAVLPRLKDFGDYVMGTIVPALGSMAGFVKDNLDFFGPFAAAVVAIVAALKVWAVVQAVVNAVMEANPIGLVVIAIAALVAGVIWAYNHFETFHNIVDAAWDGIQTAAQFAWENVLKPIFGYLVDTVIAAWETFQTFKDVISTVWDNVKQFVTEGVNRVVTTVFWMAEQILNAAETAFGWVPGIGEKLGEARQKFEVFRDQVNAALGGVNDENIKITADMVARELVSGGNAIALGTAVGRMASGGGVSGPGTGTSDTAGVFRLSNGEHVLTAADVQAMGGQGSVMAFRKSLHGMRAGGPVQFNVNTALPDPNWLAGEAASFRDRNADAFGKKVAAQLAASGTGAVENLGAGRVSILGKLLDATTANIFQKASAALGGLQLLQGSWSSSVEASGDTHSGSGAMDVSPVRATWDAAVAMLRSLGAVAWHRTPAQGPWGDHIHSITPGIPGLSPSAAAQVADFRRGGDGLGALAGGGPIRKFDRGGWLPTGATMAINNTGGPERILGPQDQIDLSDSTIERLAYVMLGASGQAVGQLVGARTAAVRSRVR